MNVVILDEREEYNCGGCVQKMLREAIVNVDFMKLMELPPVKTWLGGNEPIMREF